jgi:hypothetical protein
MQLQAAAPWGLQELLSDHVSGAAVSLTGPTQPPATLLPLLLCRADVRADPLGLQGVHIGLERLDCCTTEWKCGTHCVPKYWLEEGVGYGSRLCNPKSTKLCDGSTLRLTKMPAWAAGLQIMKCEHVHTGDFHSSRVDSIGALRVLCFTVPATEPQQLLACKSLASIFIQPMRACQF